MSPDTVKSACRIPEPAGLECSVIWVGNQAGDSRVWCAKFSLCVYVMEEICRKGHQLQCKSNPASAAVCGLATKEAEQPVILHWCGSLSADLAELVCTLCGKTLAFNWTQPSGRANNVTYSAWAVFTCGWHCRRIFYLWDQAKNGRNQRFLSKYGQRLISSRPQ